MTPDQFTAVIIALTGLVTALGAIFVQLRQTHSLINSRMTQLVAETKLAGTLAGQIEGREQEATRAAAVIAAEGRSGSPIHRSPSSN
jgi:vacuolar-type H+-ATPase subunit B/Vma2